MVIRASRIFNREPFFNREKWIDDELSKLHDKVIKSLRERLSELNIRAADVLIKIDRESLIEQWFHDDQRLFDVCPFKFYEQDADNFVNDKITVTLDYYDYTKPAP